MFERYPKQSVRALFLARGAALTDGTPLIESVHLLAGVLEVLELAPVQHEALMHQVGLAARPQPPGPGAPEIPFGDEVKAGLNAAVMIADTLGHHRIRERHSGSSVGRQPTSD